jgi:hypothetical protein
MLRFCLILPCIIVTLLVCLCNSKSANPIITNQNLVTYHFTAVEDRIGDSSFAAFRSTIGDTLSGTISYLLNTPNEQSLSDSNVGNYFPTNPSKISFKFDSLQFNSNSNYEIIIDNNDSSTLPVRDDIRISADDTISAHKMNMSKVQVDILFQDLTANVFSNISLPSSISLQNYDNNADVFLNIMTSSANANIRLQIIEVNRIEN